MHFPPHHLKTQAAVSRVQTAIGHAQMTVHWRSGGWKRREANQVMGFRQMHSSPLWCVHHVPQMETTWLCFKPLMCPQPRTWGMYYITRCPSFTIFLKNKKWTCPCPSWLWRWGQYLMTLKKRLPEINFPSTNTTQLPILPNSVMGLGWASANTHGKRTATVNQSRRSSHVHSIIRKTKVIGYYRNR